MHFPRFMTPPIYIDFHRSTIKPHQTEQLFFLFHHPPSTLALDLAPNPRKVANPFARLSAPPSHSRTKPIAIANPLRTVMPTDRANGSRGLCFHDPSLSPHLHRHPQPEEAVLRINIFSDLRPSRLALALALSVLMRGNDQLHWHSGHYS